MFTLVVVQGPEKGRVFPLDRDSVVLGRSPDVEGFLDSPVVSRRHAQIWQRDGSFSIEDLSSNGIHLNGRRISQRAALADGDLIQIGPYVFGFRGREVAASAMPSEVAAAPSEDL